MYARSISQEDISTLPRVTFKGRILLVTSLQELKNVLPLLRSKDTLGFDTETKPSFRKGIRNRIALLQLADSSDAFLFRVNTLGLPDELAEILEDSSIRKIGAAVHDDLRSLNTIRKMKPQSFIDLQKYSLGYRIEDKSVRKLAAIVLNVNISKSQQLSDWERHELTRAQMQYAATDAWICHEIYNRLRKTDFSG